jgi:hypothetical protein
MTNTERDNGLIAVRVEVEGGVMEWTEAGAMECCRRLMEVGRVWSLPVEEITKEEFLKRYPSTPLPEESVIDIQIIEGIGPPTPPARSDTRTADQRSS